ncbi:MAG: VOC family protein [Actinomycetota bacterium]|nr:VOC family protein [Actinomycetota bacterium]
MRNESTAISPTAGVDLDHIGIAVESVQAPLEEVVGRLGATVLYGGEAPGCRFVQTRIGDAASTGMTVELLEPLGTDPFLGQFLERFGAGAHHLTFRVLDVIEVVDRFADCGLHPVIRRDLPLWKEAFYSPKDGGGMILQLAESGGPDPAEAFDAARRDEALHAEGQRYKGWYPDTPAWWGWPGERGEVEASLESIVLRVPDLEKARVVYERLLEGVPEEETDEGCTLRWPGGGRLTLVQNSTPRGGFDYLNVSGTPSGPEAIGGARVVFL